MHGFQSHCLLLAHVKPFAPFFARLAINYIQSLEQAVKLSGGRLDAENLAASLSATAATPSDEIAPTARKPVRSSFSKSNGPKKTMMSISFLGGHSNDSNKSFNNLDGSNTNKKNDLQMDVDAEENEDDTDMAMSDVEEHRNGKVKFDIGHIENVVLPPTPPASHGHSLSSINSTPHKKGGFSPLDLLVGVAEQARRVTGTGHHNHQVHLKTGVQPDIAKLDEKNLKKGANGASWTHIEVGEGH